MIRILWQCDSAVAVDKPAGLSTTSPPGTDSLEFRLRDQLAAERGFLAAVHRLDRDVSGVVLVALTKKTARLLSEQFAIRKVRKTYHAWVQGRVDIDASAESPSSERTTQRWTDYLRKIPDVAKGEICRAEDAGAKLAETDVSVLEYDGNADCSLIELSPLTGRMHQLRLQTAARGHAILSDPIYGSTNCTPPKRDDWTFDTIALVAMKLQFHHPRTGVLTNVALERLI
ncbi:23S rRNA-/tRNA-specific pseudouridylate synthase [Rhodopirellula rubra]|uniref:23S rRNA-/tRNA-specific pseudouridylate synthase n=1 Tax=Aporhodopirellula rubra TaxID=980271 RepID=A0A7W5DZZ7_9BACT|nr:RNA pseudouridine synthase [Aporhodopirellula rubra]MBB3207585.1 23S rRNA-/tRNA-specific pseudouridylate synthase [Aporhodopirellula rubra]